MTLTLAVLRLVILALLWFFVYAVAKTIRADLASTTLAPRPEEVPASAPMAAAAAPPVAAAAAAAPARRPRRGAPTRLVVTAGPQKGTVVALGTAAITLGRDPSSTLVLVDDYASTRHARLIPHEGRWLLEDAGSTNGTFIGKQRVTAAVAMSPGTSFTIGQTVLELRK